MTEVTDDDVGKPILTDRENRIGTLREVDYPTLYFELADDIDENLKSNMTIAETTYKRHNGRVLASAPIGSVESVTDTEIRFWPAYASESRDAKHESVSYGDIPEEGAQSEGGQK